MGTWRELRVVADMPPTAATLAIAVEKGINERAVIARIRLNDVKLVAKGTN